MAREQQRPANDALATTTCRFLTTPHLTYFDRSPNKITAVTRMPTVATHTSKQSNRSAAAPKGTPRSSMPDRKSWLDGRSPACTTHSQMKHSFAGHSHIDVTMTI